MRLGKLGLYPFFSDYRPHEALGFRGGSAFNEREWVIDRMQADVSGATLIGKALQSLSKQGRAGPNRRASEASFKMAGAQTRAVHKLGPSTSGEALCGQHLVLSE